MAQERDIRGRQISRVRRWGSYALGILIEVAAVATISLIALLILYLVKVVVA